jgi:GNAT superfamily N-acetyltransferase
MPIRSPKNVVVEVTRPRLRQGMLESGNRNDQKTEAFPYGFARALGLNRLEERRQWRLIRRNGTLFAQRLGDDCRPSRTLPEVNLSTDPWRPAHQTCRVDLEFHIAADDVTLIRARQLLERSHPHRSPTSGIFLVCSLVDAASRDEFLAAPENEREDPWSSAWAERRSRVVGCVVMSRLFHGNPRGRAEIAAAAGVDFTPDMGRDETIKRLRVAWLSRIAVDAPYRRTGIGTAMVAEARQVATTRTPWQPSYIEVIRTVSSAQAKEKLEVVSDDFLTRAGYRLIDLQARCSPLRLYDDDGRRQTDATPCRQLYYWTKVP